MSTSRIGGNASPWPEAPLVRPRLQILDAELISSIVDEAQRLLDHGLPTDATGTRVLFPADVVEAAIASAPRSFTLHDRDGKPHAELGGNNVHFVPGSSGLKILDHRTGEARLANTADFTEYVRLGDG